MRGDGALLAAVGAALAAGVVLLVGTFVALPSWLGVLALAVMAAAAVTFAAVTWRQARDSGAGLLRSAGRAAWRTFRLLLDLLP